jgi:hypothetical protein
VCPRCAPKFNEWKKGKRDLRQAGMARATARLTRPGMTDADREHVKFWRWHFHEPGSAEPAQFRLF